VTDVPTILAAAHRAKQEGAQFVVLSMHWGGQYQVAPHADEQLEAQQLLASPDVDLIFGDHEHVVQPVEKIGDKYVVFGMGNILSNQSAAT
jgi:poly-gamma-glutamate synthesis protein (capsule biosynthesis protein)